MIKLGINIDHIATLRNARKENDPSIIQGALEAQAGGADLITVHLREDRRHILDNDIFEIKKHIKIPMNLEMAATLEMLNTAKKLKPKSVCIVPEKREEITTEGGLNLTSSEDALKEIIPELQKNDIQVFLFIEPDIDTLKIAKKLNVQGIEIHTGAYAKTWMNETQKELELNRIFQASVKANELSLEFHAGHGLNYHNIFPLLKLANLTEVNIGHSIIADALFYGLKKSVKKMKNLIQTGSV